MGFNVQSVILFAEIVTFYAPNGHENTQISGSKSSKQASIPENQEISDKSLNKAGEQIHEFLK